MKKVRSVPSTTKKELDRIKRHFPDGVCPRHIRVYDNGGETADRYTVVFSGRYRTLHGNHGEFCVLGMSEDPYYPLGVGLVNWYDKIIDYPSYRHLGKKIKFKDLSADSRHLTIDVYISLWNLSVKQWSLQEYRDMVSKEPTKNARKTNAARSS